MRKSIRPNDGDAMELDCRYVLHIPLSKWENGEVVPLDVDDEIEELIFCLEVQGFDGFYLTKVKSHYKSRRYDELLLTIFAGDGDGPCEIFRDWFFRHNDVLCQEAFAVEVNNRMIIGQMGFDIEG